MRVAVVHNMEVSSLGLVGVALAEAGAELTEFFPYRDGALPDPDAYDGLVVLGGAQSAIDDSLHPYLPRLAEVMRGFTAADRAVLGICLGSQVLARAHYGRNILGAAPEFAWQPIRLTTEGLADPVLSAAGAEFLSFQWHSDTIALPPDAVHLAEGAAVRAQAYRVGRASYGMQFHFEADGAVVDEWTENFPEATEEMRPGWQKAYPAEAARNAAKADAAGLALARAWVAQI